MKRITFTAGIEYAGDNLLPSEVVEAALADIRTRLAAEAGGYTETATYGGWNDLTGHLVQERSARFMVLADDDWPADDVAQFIGQRLQQEAVAMEVEPVVNARIVAIAPPKPVYPPIPVDAEAWALGDAATGT